MANKKITELPFINTLTGSSVFDNPVLNTVVPVVMYGTTNQITVENYAKFINLYNAHTGSAGNTFTGPQTINNNVTINGTLRVHEIVAQYETSSILFSTGSTKLGDQLTDKHEFTGSTNITGALYYNDVLVTNIDANTIERLQQTTASLNSQTASQDLVNVQISSTTGSINTTTSSFDNVFFGISSVTGAINTTTSSFDSVFLGISSVTGAINTTTSSFDSVFFGISSVTGSINTTTASFDSVFLGISSVTGAINTTTASFDSVFLRISSTTGSINTTTASFDSVFFGISSVTGAINTQSSSQDLVNRQISLVSGSIHFTTGALNEFTGSVIGQSNTIAAFTSSVNFTTQSLNTQTGSQNSLNTSLGLITSSIYGEITSFNNVFERVSSTTASINTTTSSFDSVFLRISSTTGSMNTQSSSQDLVNLGISSVTGSLIGITNGLMAFTAALDSTYATDAQLYQLYQATASIHSTTQSLNVQTGSQDLVNVGISSVTGSINTTTASFNSVFAEIGSTTSSLIGITNGLMAFTAALDSTYATDAQLYQLYQATSSIQFTTSSLNVQTGSQDLVNLGISTFTGSQNVINSSVDVHILNQSIQTGSQDLVNLGISTFTGSLRSEVNLIEAYTASLKGAIVVSGTNVEVLGTLTAQEIYTTYVTSSVMYQSGSTKFGDSSDDTHQITGSLKVTGNTTIGTATAATNVLLSLNGVSGKAQRIQFQNSGTDQWLLGAGAASETDAFELYNASGTIALHVSKSNSSATFTNIETTFNFNPQTNLLSGYNYLNFGGGSIMYRNNSDIYFGSNAKYGSAGTVVANYTSANGMGLLTMDGGNLRWQANDTSVTAGTAYGVPIRFAINGDGKVLVNSNVGNYKFQVNSGISTSQAMVMSLQQATDGAIKDAAGFGVSINNGGEATNAADLLISTATGGSLTTKVTVGSSGDVTVSNGNLVIGTSGKGIDFSATSNGSGTTSSELLNDYEEGTWTPTVVAASGTYTTVTNQRGTYTKIGRQVTVQFYFIVSNKGTGTAGAGITNLPFTVKSTSVGDQYVGSMINTSTSVISSVIAGQNDTFAGIYKYDGTDPITATQGNAGSLTYFV